MGAVQRGEKGASQQCDTKAREATHSGRCPTTTHEEPANNHAHKSRTEDMQGIVRQVLGMHCKAASLPLSPTCFFMRDRRADSRLLCLRFNRFISASLCTPTRCSSIHWATGLAHIHTSQHPFFHVCILHRHEASIQHFVQQA